MAAEAQAEGPAPAPPPPLAHGSSPASPEKRALPVQGDGGEQRPPEPKRRRACVAALDSLPCAAAASAAAEEEVDGPGAGLGGDGASFSFHHARGGFVALETTPKFGSFNPPSAAEQAALDLKPAQPDAEGSVPEAAAEVPSASAHGEDEEEEDKDENSQIAEVDGPGPDIIDDSVLTFEQP